MNLPDTLKFIPGFRHSPESGFVETLPKIELPNGDALLINGYSAHCKNGGEDTPTLEERNAISAELVARWNAKARLKVADPDALPKGVCIVLYRRGGLFAVSQRLSTCGHAGMWQFPGGHVEPGEAPLDAAIRELREETGLEIASHRFLHIGTTKPLVGYKGETYVGYRYGVTLDERMVADIGNPEPHKHTSWRWVNHRTLLELDMLQETKPYALEYALNCETSR